MSGRRGRCGTCEGCLADECGTCRMCIDMKKRGGPGTIRKPCENRACVQKYAAGDAAAAPRERKYKAPRQPAIAYSVVKKPRPDPARPFAAQARALVALMPCKAAAAAATTVDGVAFCDDDLAQLCAAVGDEPAAAEIDWAKVAAKLNAVDDAVDRLLRLRRAATARDDESRAQRNYTRSRSVARAARRGAPAAALTLGTVRL
ncbi:hypothetical protein M885DRAFT_300033 [Pelagophyceae sp. CCMP2097]|nr:hypothetical protein M885DRAFT_300033 [Pelagophyceae sp. CCMP2097]